MPDNQHLILLHSVLIPMCRMIPVPFVDDLVKDGLERRMVTSIAESHGHKLTGKEVNALIGHEAGGCGCWGCLVYLPLLPFKKAIQKILLFFEWKSTVDLGSRMYVEGYLLDLVFRDGLWTDARAVHDALDRVVVAAGTSPVEAAFNTVWTGARQGITNASGQLAARMKKLVGVKPEQRQAAVTRALDELELEEDPRLQALLQKLAQELSKIHGDYFEKLRELVRTELGQSDAQGEKTTSS